MGYILMLATMTFSAELLIMTVTGLSIGYTIFFQTLGDDSYLSDNTHVNVNPCCNFMEEEAKEQNRPANVIGGDGDSVGRGGGGGSVASGTIQQTTIQPSQYRSSAESLDSSTGGGVP